MWPGEPTVPKLCLTSPTGKKKAYLPEDLAITLFNKSEEKIMLCLSLKTIIGLHFEAWVSHMVPICHS